MVLKPSVPPTASPFVTEGQGAATVVLDASSFQLANVLCIVIHCLSLRVGFRAIVRLRVRVKWLELGLGLGLRLRLGLFRVMLTARIGGWSGEDYFPPLLAHPFLAV